jgi:ATP-dependent DNA helicase RecQ
VIHLGPPGSIEAYYQEVGRAGRDGAAALGLLLVSGSDLPLRRALLERGVDGAVPDPAVVEHKWGMFLELIRWVEGGSCRHDAILRYFGDEAETLAGCGRCDVCRELEAAAPEEEDAERTTLIVRKALSGVARVHARFGLQTVVKLVRGEPDERLERAGLTRVPTHGNLKEHPEVWILALLRRCVSAGWVSFSGRERPVVVLTEEGRAVMKGERPVRLLLPSAGRRAAAAPAAARSSDPGRRRASRDAAELDSAAQTLFEALRRHRLAVARAEGLAPFIVASDRTLRDIAMLKPRTRAELEMAHGVGPHKAERYGPGLLRVVAEETTRGSRG